MTNSYFSLQNMHVGMKRRFSEWSSFFLAISKSWCKYMTIIFDLEIIRIKTIYHNYQEDRTLTWSQPRTQGASEEWSDLDFFRVKFSIPSCWEWSGSSGLWLWAPSGAILKGGHRTAPCRSTINLGEEERDTSPDWPGPRRSKSKIYFSSLGLPANFRLNCLSSLFGWNRARSLNCFLWLEVFSGTKWLLLLLFFSQHL